MTRVAGASKELSSRGDLPESRAAGCSPWVVDGALSDDQKLCGGKTVGLARLLRGGLTVPETICVTTVFYRDWLAAAGIAGRLEALCTDPRTHDPNVRDEILGELRRLVDTAAVPDVLVVALRDGIERLRPSGDGPMIVRSSAAHEDSGDASYAGIHTSVVVDAPDTGAVLAAIKTCWASLWTEAAWTYRQRVGIPHAMAAMAVVVQPYIRARRAGVAFSLDPLTGDRDTVVIEARSAAAAGAGEHRSPETYRVSTADIAPADGARPVATASTGHRGDTARAGAGPAVLDPAQILEVARLATAAERALGTATDIEWVFDGRTFWTVQARPITALAAPTVGSAPRGTLWTRANVKEVFPELPSPLTLSYLSAALDRMFTSYHASQGYRLPPDVPFVRVFRGRPYLNLTLMHHMTRARGGDPGVVARLFGGDRVAPAETPNGRADVPIGDGLRLAREMLATFFRTPRRGHRLFRRMRRQARAFRTLAVERFDDATLIAHLERFVATLLDERTTCRLHEVVSAQSRAYMALEGLLTAWVGPEADTLVKRLMTGLGTLPNAQMTHRLMEIAVLAASEPRARAFFVGEPDEHAVGAHRAALAGTRCLGEIARFLEDFGHRGPYESDVMSARFDEDPTPVLRLIGLYTRADVRLDPVRHVAERNRVREAARQDVRRALHRGRRRLAFATRWALFMIVCDALQRLLALRDRCRHVTTFMVAHLRRMALEIGRRATRQGRFARPEDVFFLTLNELPRVLREGAVDWRRVTSERRRDRARHEGLEAPDLLRDDQAHELRRGERETAEDLVGCGVSPGVVTGIVRVLRSAADLRHLRGEIVVFPTIEPTLTPIFPLVQGLVAEMGGLLSHAAILAREYGLPAVVNVRDATRRLRDGDRVELDGTSGRIRVIERATAPAAAAAVSAVSGTARWTVPAGSAGTARGRSAEGPRP